MNQSDVDVIGQVLRTALEKHQREVEQLIESRAAEMGSAQRAVDAARDLVAEAEERLRRAQDHAQSDFVRQIQRTAADELVRVQNLLIERMTRADLIASRMEELQADLRRTIEAAAELQAPQVGDVADAIKADPDFVDQVKGAPGDPGDPGAAGADGVGIDAPVWVPGVYRANALVQHNVGQLFRALRDTGEEPHNGGDWARVGTAGFRFAEPWTEGATYENGDLFVRDYGTFAWVGGKAHLLAGRGAKGDRGERGERGKDGTPGKDGRDGVTIESIELKGYTLAVITRDAAGRLQTHDVDFLPAFEKLGDALQTIVFERVIAQLGAQS